MAPPSKSKKGSRPAAANFDKFQNSCSAAIDKTSICRIIGHMQNTTPQTTTHEQLQRTREAMIDVGKAIQGVVSNTVATMTKLANDMSDSIGDGLAPVDIEHMSDDRIMGSLQYWAARAQRMIKAGELTVTIENMLDAHGIVMVHHTRTAERRFQLPYWDKYPEPGTADNVYILRTKPLNYFAWATPEWKLIPKTLDLHRLDNSPPLLVRDARIMPVMRSTVSEDVVFAGHRQRLGHLPCGDCYYAVTELPITHYCGNGHYEYKTNSKVVQFRSAPYLSNTL